MFFYCLEYRCYITNITVVVRVAGIGVAGVGVVDVSGCVVDVGGECEHDVVSSVVSVSVRECVCVVCVDVAGCGCCCCWL